MLAKKFRARFFYLLIACKLLIFLWLIILWISHSYSATQSREILLITVPLFTANITHGIKYYLKSRKKAPPIKAEQPVSGPIRVVGFAGTVLYGLAIIFFLTYYATLSGDDDSFLALKEWIGITEIMFGVYIGIIVTDLFDLQGQDGGS